MKIALTGASGFIGRHVLADLAAREIDIVAVTRSARKLEQWQGRVQIAEMDVGDAAPDQLDCLAQCDTLVHLAWDGLPNYNASRHVDTELPVQYRFLKELIERGLPALLVAGTCFEYGMQSGALSEETAALPANPYGIAKDHLRRQIELLARHRPFAMTWARLFYTYGDGQAATSLYPQLAAAVARADQSFDMSGGEQLRDYLPVADVAHLLVELALRGADAGVVNVCAGQPVSVRSLVEGWLVDNGWDMRLNLGKYPYPDYEPMAFWGTRSKLDKILGNPGQP